MSWFSCITMFVTSEIVVVVKVLLVLFYIYLPGWLLGSERNNSWQQFIYKYTSNFEIRYSPWISSMHGHGSLWWFTSRYVHFRETLCSNAFSSRSSREVFSGNVILFYLGFFVGLFCRKSFLWSFEWWLSITMVYCFIVQKRCSSVGTCTQHAPLSCDFVS